MGKDRSENQGKCIGGMLIFKEINFTRVEKITHYSSWVSSSAEKMLELLKSKSIGKPPTLIKCSTGKVTIQSPIRGAM